MDLFNRKLAETDIIIERKQNRRKVNFNMVYFEME